MHPWLIYCILIFVLRYRAGVVYVLILSISFFYLFTKKLYRESSQLPTFFCRMCPYIINTFFGKIPIKRIPQFAMTVSPFFEIYVLILSILLLHILSQYSTFFNACLYLFINCPLRANQSVYI